MKKSKCISLVLVSAALASCNRQISELEKNDVYFRPDTSEVYQQVNYYNTNNMWYYSFHPYYYGWSPYGSGAYWNPGYYYCHGPNYYNNCWNGQDNHHHRHWGHRVNHDGNGHRVAGNPGTHGRGGFGHYGMGSGTAVS